MHKDEVQCELIYYGYLVRLKDDCQCELTSFSTNDVHWYTFVFRITSDSARHCLAADWIFKYPHLKSGSFKSSLGIFEINIRLCKKDVFRFILKLNLLWHCLRHTINAEGN